MTDKQTENADILPDEQGQTPEVPETGTATATEKVVVKRSGTGLSLLALLVALGIGGAGFYLGQQQVTKIEQKLTALESGNHSSGDIDLTQEREQLARLLEENRAGNAKIENFERQLAEKEQTLAELRTQIDKIRNRVKAEQPSDWLLSEADFLLTSALRKIVLDNDVDTGISLLKVADEVLEKVSDSRVVPVRAAINNDLKQLLSVNNVDQNAIMQRLSQLANTVDELAVMNVNFAESTQEDSQVSDSVTDWQSNLKKSAASFLDHFIRISPKTADSKELLAPNQDIYLRENIRLRLQIAILAVPRQQNELYKQSLETVASWVRTYFDTNTEVAQGFLKSIDELAEQSVYIDVPEKLTSLSALDKVLNKPETEVKKISLSADKGLSEEHPAPAAAEQPAEEQLPAPAEQQPADTKAQ